MQARAPLMIEHRLIGRMIALMKDALGRIRSDGKVDPLFVDAAIDFLRVYADRTHHGKEEDILFRDLDGKDLSSDDRRMMNDLIEDHVHGRVAVEALIAANMRYRNGETAALADIAAKLADLADFYPKHIETEDKVFFPASRRYLSDAEDQAMLAEFEEFDRKIIHDKYKAVIEALGG
jgi:hemerythrin-like domain-containing protein